MADGLLEETADFGLIFSPWLSIAGCTLWTAIWVLFHFMPCQTWARQTDRQKALGTSTKTIAQELAKTSQAVQIFYVRKLHRMFIYCSLASVAGMSMFLSCFFKQQPTECMLMSFGPIQQFFFWMAVGHWITALWEDWRTRHFLGQGLTVESGSGLALFPLNLCCSSSQVMYLTYTVHHVMTIFAYVYALCTYQLGGVMVQGLLFELPVVLMLRRELGHSFSPKPLWLQDSRRVRTHHLATYLAFLLGRGPAECLWIVSMLPTSYGNELLEQSLRDPSIVVYHTLAAFFTSLNVRILGLLFCWHGQDVSQAMAEGEKAAEAVSKETSKA